MSKVKIDKDDANRILLTELLPYEVPILFSNDGFYNIVSSGSEDYFMKKVMSRKQEYGVPFNYEIAKSNNSDTRTLSIIHPANQLSFIEFYKKYDTLLINLCSKSPFSLRKVAKVAKFFYSSDLVIDEDKDRVNDAEVEPDVLGLETKILKSYFVYKPVDLIYKFYDRNEYQRLEQRFDYLWEFDISKCFYHIYTHSITWAVKDKESAKRNKGFDSFENQFDALMQKANYNETNGILVGPEISRLFAEVILQEVDLHVLRKLEQKNHKFGIDYEIRRYVDDFFVFSNDENILEDIFKTYKKELEYYKLYINPAKTEKRKTPFITNIAVGKRQLKQLVDTFHDSLFEKASGNEAIGAVTILKPLRNPYHFSQNFIRDFQCIVKQNDLTYDVLNKDVVRMFKRKLVSLLRHNADGQGQESLENYLLIFLDIIFYCYSLNINASATFKISQIIVILSKFVADKSNDFKHTIFSKISRESEFVMTTYQRKTKSSDTNIETLNLLISLRKLGAGYLITEKKIREYFGIHKIEAEPPAKEVERFLKLNYFQIITLLYYFGDIPEYGIFKSIIIKTVVKKFEIEQNPFQKSEFTCLFFDFICCPYVPIEMKRKVVRHSHYATTDIDVEIQKISEQQMWFMNWDQDIDLERVLKKKEWAAAY